MKHKALSCKIRYKERYDSEYAEWLVINGIDRKTEMRNRHRLVNEWWQTEGTNRKGEFPVWEEPQTFYERQYWSK